MSDHGGDSRLAPVALLVALLAKLGDDLAALVVDEAILVAVARDGKPAGLGNGILDVVLYPLDIIGLGFLRSVLGIVISIAEASGPLGARDRGMVRSELDELEGSRQEAVVEEGKPSNELGHLERFDVS